MCGSEIRLSIESSSRLKKTTEHCTVVVRERSTGPHGENTMNDVHNTHDFPLLFGKPPLFGKPSKVPKKTLPGPKKVTDMTQKKSLALKYIDPPFFAKKKTGPIWYTLASAAPFLIYPSVEGVTTLCYILIPRSPRNIAQQCDNFLEI